MGGGGWGKSICTTKSGALAQPVQWEGGSSSMMSSWIALDIFGQN